MKRYMPAQPAHIRWLPSSPGGKAQFGGQRLGENGSLGLEAYGAAYLLQEFPYRQIRRRGRPCEMYEKIVGRQFP